MLASFLCRGFFIHIPCWLHFCLWSFSYTSSAGFIFVFGVSLTHLVLASFLCGEFLLHIPCYLHFYAGSFSYTPRAGFSLSLSLFNFFYFIWGVSLTHPVLALFLSGEFLLHIPCWHHFYLGSFSYTSHAGFIFYSGSSSYTSHAGFIFNCGVSLTHPVLASFFFLGRFSYTSRAGFIFMRRVSLTHPVLTSFLCGEFLLHIRCWLHFYAGTFFYISRDDFDSVEFLLYIPYFFHFYLGTVPYTSRAGFIFMGGMGGGEFFFISRVGFIFMWGVSITHPVLASFLCGEFLLHIPCWLHFYVGSFPYTPRVVFTFTQGVSLTLPVVAYIYILTYSTWGMSLLYIYILHILWGSLSEEFSLTHPCFIFIWGVSLTHPALASFLCGVFLLHIPCWLYFYLGSFFYTSRAGIIFIWGVSLTHPMLALFFIRGVPLTHHMLASFFYLWSFSYTSRAGFIVFFFSGAFLLHIPALASFLSGMFLLHILC